MDSNTLSVTIGFAGAVIGGILGGAGSWLASYHATKRNIESQNNFFQQNVDYDRKKQEENEKQNIKENALVVYYDLKLGLIDVKKLYLHYGRSKDIQAPTQMYFCDNWINNVAILSKDKDLEKYINAIYQLYGELQSIKQFLYKYQYGEVNKNIFLDPLKDNLLEFKKNVFNDVIDDDNDRVIINDLNFKVELKELYFEILDNLKNKI